MVIGTLPPPGDVFALAAALVDVPSESFQEAAIADLIEAELRSGALDVHRIGDNIVARTNTGRPRRIVLGGHTDTVPAQNNAKARIERDADGEVLWGLGSVDMKGGVAVLLELARTLGAQCPDASDEPMIAADATFVFYAREEVANHHNGLHEVQAARPDLLEGDVAVLAEPTGGAVEAGCQGTMRMEVALAGERAHTARAWMGRNAIHRLARLLECVSAYEPRRVVVDGCEYREGLQAVGVSGGVAGNVVPDEATLTINHRFAPDRTPAQAEQHVRATLSDTGVLGADDTLEIVDMAPAAAPGLGHPLMSRLVTLSGKPVRAKLGWTDVAFFASHGVPASNFGPGDPTMAHTAGEHVHRHEIDDVYAALHDLLRTPTT